MGEARRRGSYEERKKKAIDQGKDKKKPIRMTRAELNQLRAQFQRRQMILHAITPKPKPPEVNKYVDPNPDDTRDHEEQAMHEDQINKDGEKDPS